MAGVASAQFARIAGVSVGWLHRVLKVLEFKPVARVPGSGGIQFRWSRSQVVALLALPRLEKMGVAETIAARFVQRLGSMSDEVFEHLLFTGRTWVMVVGSGIHPDLLFRANITRHAAQRAEELAALGLSITGVDLSQLFIDVRNAVAAQEQEDGSHVSADVE